MASGDERWREEAERVVTAAGFDLEDFSVVSAISRMASADRAWMRAASSWAWPRP